MQTPSFPAPEFLVCKDFVFLVGSSSDFYAWVFSYAFAHCVVDFIVCCFRLIIPVYTKPQHVPNAFLDTLLNSLKREILAWTMPGVVEVTVAAQLRIGVGKAQQRQQFDGCGLLFFTKLLFVEVAFKAHTDRLVVVAIDMGSYHLTRPTFIHLAFLVDEIMIANARLAFVLVPMVNVGGSI